MAINNYFRRLEFASDLSTFRERENLTIADVADLAECSTTYVYYVERGDEYDNRIEILMRLADVMNVDFRFYLGRK